jgi:ribose 5-phosphate isomerase RpiB
MVRCLRRTPLQRILRCWTGFGKDVLENAAGGVFAAQALPYLTALL